jgi:hypothetical protein
MVLMNRSVEDSLREVLHLSLTMFERDRSNKRIPIKRVPILNINSHNPWSLLERPELDINIWTFIHLNEISTSSTFNEYCASVENDPEIRPYLNQLEGTVLFAKPFNPSELYRDILLRYLELSECESQFREDSFKRVIMELCSYIGSEAEVEVLYQAVLEGCHMNIDQIELAPGVVIKRLELDEIERLWNNNSSFRECYPVFGSFSFAPVDLNTLICIRTSQKELGSKRRPW